MITSDIILHNTHSTCIAYCCIIRSRSDDIVIKRVPLDVQNQPGVSAYFGGVHINTTSLKETKANLDTAAQSKETSSSCSVLETLHKLIRELLYKP